MIKWTMKDTVETLKICLYVIIGCILSLYLPKALGSLGFILPPIVEYSIIMLKKAKTVAQDGDINAKLDVIEDDLYAQLYGLVGKEHKNKKSTAHQGEPTVER